MYTDNMHYRSHSGHSNSTIIRSSFSTSVSGIGSVHNNNLPSR